MFVRQQNLTTASKLSTAAVSGCQLLVNSSHHTAVSQVIIKGNHPPIHRRLIFFDKHNQQQNFDRCFFMKMRQFSAKSRIFLEQNILLLLHFYYFFVRAPKRTILLHIKNCWSSILSPLYLNFIAYIRINYTLINIIPLLFVIHDS